MTSALVRSRADDAARRQVDKGDRERGQRLLATVRRLVGRHPVALIAAIVVLLRLPMLEASPGADESGYLIVGGQWDSAGSSLYGSYWVDRPPLLISLFSLAAHVGGLVPLRVLGCVAAFLLVTGAAHVAARMGGRPAAVWAAVAAAGWCLSPLTGSPEVDGELLAAPFVVWGIDATLAALDGVCGTRVVPRRAGWQAVVAGALAMSALLVKQNFADVAVFALVCVGVAMSRRELSGRNTSRLVALGGAGAGTVLVVVAGWTVLHGTSLVGVYDAMYPFRIRAAQMMAASGDQAPASRFAVLLLKWVLCGLAPVTVLTAWAFLSRRVATTGTVALTAVLVFDMASVVMGGNYWSHYLMQLVTPAAVLAGVLAARRQPGLRPIIVGAAVVGMTVLGIALPGALASSSSQRLGHAVGAASRPGDTIVTVYGHSDVSQTSGLFSPYPYLWSLPLKTLDPRLRFLDSVLARPRAPTWFVTYAGISSWGVDSTRTSRLVHERYHPVAVLEGHTVYLRDGVRRRPPAVSGETTPQR